MATPKDQVLLNGQPYSTQGSDTDTDNDYVILDDDGIISVAGSDITHSLVNSPKSPSSPSKSPLSYPKADETSSIINTITKPDTSKQTTDNQPWCTTVKETVTRLLPCFTQPQPGVNDAWQAETDDPHTYYRLTDIY